MSLQEYKNRHKGERCFIIGNGPSLNDIDLSLLKGEHTFGSNRIYLSGFVPEYYVCVNPLVLEQFYFEWTELDTVKFVPQNWAKEREEHGASIGLDTSLGEPAFSSPEGPIWEGHTVTYVALQLASYMGFKEVILIGCDHDYGLGGLQGAPNQPVTGGDTGHFHPDYFKGVAWNLPDLAMSELAYSLARAAYEKDGRRVVNASTRTKLRVFPLVNFNRLFASSPRVSAVVSAYKTSEECFWDCLRDLVEQTEKIEIVVVCQERTFEELVLVKKIRYPVIFVTTPDIPTVYEAWNLGIKAAHGKYITNANTDDRHHPRAFEIMADALDGRPDIDLVYHNSFITWENQGYREFVEQHKDAELVPGRQPGLPGYFAWADYDRGALTRGCYIGPQPMWRHNLHQLYGYFNPQYRSAGDYDFWLRVARERNFYHVPLFLGLYHASEEGIELSDPQLSRAESVRALEENQSQQVSIDPMLGHLRIALDGSYTFIEKDKFLDMAEWVKYT